jgi:hypothetical protein
VAVALAGVSAGAYELATHLRAPDVMPVIGDVGTAFPATGESITVTSPGGETVTLAGEDADLYREIRWMREGLESGGIVLDQAVFFEMLPDDVAARLASDPDADAALRFAVAGIASDPFSLLDRIERALLGITQVTVYLEDSATVEQAAALQAEVAGMPEAESATLVSKEQALEELKRWYADQPEVFAGLTGNPLPAQIRVDLKPGADVDSFVERCRALPAVDEVRMADAVASDLWLQAELAILRALVYRTAFTGIAGGDAPGVDDPGANGPATTGTTVADTGSEESRTVLHPYHNSYGDYLGAYTNGIPREVDPAVEAVRLPSVLPAYQAQVRPVPETDLAFQAEVRVDEGVVGGYFWTDPKVLAGVATISGETATHATQEPPFGGDVAQATAEAFLEDHGLWQPDLSKVQSTWESLEEVEPGVVVEGWLDHWVVRFEQMPPSDLGAVTGEFPGAIEVSIDVSGRPYQVRWSLLDLTRDGELRLRSVQDVLGDLDAWTSGAVSAEVDDWPVQSGPNTVVSGVALGLVFNSYARADDAAARYLVPVYEFGVEPMESEGRPGIWYVVAAKDTTR